MYKILVLVLDGVMDSSLALTLDSVATANRLAKLKDHDVQLSTTLFMPGRKRIRTGSGMTIAVEPKAQIKRFDALVVPGLGLTTVDEIEQFFSSRFSKIVVDWLRKAGKRCPLICASCSAVFLLAESGLLAKESVTTTWWLGSAFRERYPNVDLDETRMLVDGRRVLTAGAALAQIDLMLHLISRAASPGLSRSVARFLAIEERPSQARYMMLASVAGFGKEVVEIERWIRRNRSRNFSIGEMATALGMSTRTLDRRVRAATGKGPARFVQRLRLEHATHLIETSSLAMSEVAGAVGYCDATTLRRLLRRHLGVNPSEVRRRVGSRLRSR